QCLKYRQFFPLNQQFSGQYLHIFTEYLHKTTPYLQTQNLTLPFENTKKLLQKSCDKIFAIVYSAIYLLFSIKVSLEELYHFIGIPFFLCIIMDYAPS